VGPFWPLSGPLVQGAKPRAGARVTAAPVPIRAALLPLLFLARAVASLAQSLALSLSTISVAVAVGGGLGLPLDDRR
jgi:hypothetical protein